MPLTNRMFTLHWLGRGGGGTALVVSNKIYLILSPPPHWQSIFQSLPFLLCYTLNLFLLPLKTV